MNGYFAPLNILALALYIFSAVGYTASIFLEARNAPIAYSRNKLIALARPFLLAGIGVQVAATGSWCVSTHLSPFASLYGTLSVFAWIAAIAFAVTDLKFHLPAVGVVALPIACMALFVGLLHAHRPPDETRLLETQLISIHVLCILSSFALFVVSFGCACCYLLQNHLLKARSVNGLLRRLPPLITLDNVAYRAVIFALPLLSAGLMLGMIDMARANPRITPQQWALDPHNLIAFIVWLLYGFYLVTRLLMGWRGVRLQYLLIAGLLVACTVYFAPNQTHHFPASHQ